MSGELKPCPRCGALPCDWVNNPHRPEPDVERVARAICRADPKIRMGDANGVVEQRVDIEWHRYGWQARAAIAAMGGGDD